MRLIGHPNRRSSQLKPPISGPLSRYEELWFTVSRETKYIQVGEAHVELVVSWGASTPLAHLEPAEALSQWEHDVGPAGHADEVETRLSSARPKEMAVGSSIRP